MLAMGKEKATNFCCQNIYKRMTTKEKCKIKRIPHLGENSCLELNVLKLLDACFTLGGNSYPHGNEAQEQQAFFFPG